MSLTFLIGFTEKKFVDFFNVCFKHRLLDSFQHV